MKNELMMAIAAAGLLAGCATSDEDVAYMEDLPLAVQQTIHQQAPTGDIAKVEKDEKDDRVVYEVSFSKPSINPELHIASDGTLLKGGQPVAMQEAAGAAAVNVEPTGSNTRFEDLPLAVQNAIRAQAPNASVVDINKKVRTGVVYEVQVAEPGPSRKLHITENGTSIELEK